VQTLGPPGRIGWGGIGRGGRGPVRPEDRDPSESGHAPSVVLNLPGAGALRTGLLTLLLLAFGMLAHGQQGGYQEYLDQSGALRIAFPGGESVSKVPLHGLGEPQRVLLLVGSGPRAFFRVSDCYQGRRGGAVTGYACIAEVIGKSMPITFMLKINHPQGDIALYEVMVYRELIGHKVREGAFREQFIGKTDKDKLYFGVDLRNLSGSTLSAYHLRDAFRKLLRLYEVYLRDLRALPE